MGPIRSLHYVVIAVAALVIALAMAASAASAQTSPACALTQGAPSITGGPPPPAIPNHIVEQYKAYLTDLGNIGSRFAAVHAFYLTIVAALIGVLSFKDANRSVHNFLSPVSVVVFLFIAAVCWLWSDTLNFYSGQFAQKFDVLRAIEKQGGLLDIFTLDECYHKVRLGERRLIETEEQLALWLWRAALALAIIAMVFQLPCMRQKLPQLPD